MDDPRPRTGRVTLVGAGPGDPGLLTRRGADALARADVVLHDRLVGEGVLALCGPRARLVPVGKRKGGGCRQRTIEALLVGLARRGDDVVRLKGGDPFLFGRGAEEVAACRRAGIEVEVVPGVTAALAAPSLAGVPVTRRGASPHVTVVSGHRADDAEQDWRVLAALAREGGTLVVLMAASTAAAVAGALVAGGLDAATPVAVTVDASRPGQRVLHGRVADLVERDAPLPGPCVLTIGAVAADAASAPGAEPLHERARVAVR
jgi:uroporphyrin-III C-methyltransferase